MAQINGRLTRDAAIKDGKNNRQFVSFRVVENYDYKDKKTGKWIKKAAYISCAYGRSTAVASLLTKGTYVEVTGELDTRKYTGENGEAITDIQLRVTSLKIPTGSAKAKENNSEPVNKVTALSEPADDLPF